MTGPLEIKCRNCGAEPGSKCSEPQFGVYEFTFHNQRIADAVVVDEGLKEGETRGASDPATTKEQ